jgi:hypothetical protein
MSLYELDCYPYDVEEPSNDSPDRRGITPVS